MNNRYNRSFKIQHSRISNTLLLGLITIIVLLSACDRRPLEVILDERAKVRLVINWKVNFVTIYDQEPNGMTVMVWPLSGGTPQIKSANGNSTTLYLNPDTYRMIIYNDTPQDFDYQSFYDYYSFDDIAMRARHFTTKAWGDDVIYMYYPDDIGVALDTFVITPEMVEQDTTIFVKYNDYVKEGELIYEEHTYTYEIPEVAWPMTVNLEVKAKVKRAQSIRRIDAYISGMADGFYLSRINRTTDTGTLRLFNDNTLSWKYESIGNPTDSLYYAKFTIPSFGLPYGKELLSERNDKDNVLAFNITLTNDSVVQFKYDVGKQIKYVTPEGIEATIRYRTDLQNLSLVLDLSDTIVVPHIPESRASGFDAKVDEWDDGGVIDMGGF